MPCSDCEGHNGRPIIHGAWTTHVPAVVAEVAIKRGLALDADTDEGREKLKEMMEFRQRPWQGVSTPLTVEDTIDLGLNLRRRVGAHGNCRMIVFPHATGSSSKKGPFLR